MTAWELKTHTGFIFGRLFGIIDPFLVGPLFTQVAVSLSLCRDNTHFTPEWQRFLNIIMKTLCKQWGFL